MMSCVRRALFSREPRFEPPLSMMLITAVHAELLEDVICVFFNCGPRYNLLLAFPAVTEHADPEPPTLLVDNFGGEWVWDRLGLLKGCFVFSLSISLSLPLHHQIIISYAVVVSPLQIQGLPTMIPEDRTQAVNRIVADYATIFLPTALMISKPTSTVPNMQIR